MGKIYALARNQLLSNAQDDDAQCQMSIATSAYPLLQAAVQYLKPQINTDVDGRG
jgi:hypothetical protein